MTDENTNEAPVTDENQKPAEEEEEILSQTYLYEPEQANACIRKWLAEHSPQQPCRLTSDAPPGRLFQEYPSYWYYDITTLQHEPGEDPDPEGPCNTTVFPHLIPDIIWHKVVGPIPPCPI